MTDVEREISALPEPAETRFSRPGVSEYLLAMTHELRAPLNAVIGMSGLLLDDELTSKQRQYVKSVHAAGESLSTIVNDVLDLARVSGGRLVIEPIPFDLKSMIEETASVLSPRASERGLVLRVDWRPELPRHVIGDPGRTRQVLGNLVGHAVNGTSQGEVVIRIMPDGDRDGVPALRFVVEDTGIGISAHRLPTIFDDYVPVDASPYRSFGTTGLGLRLSAELARLMGGDIGVDSEPGRGTRFWFSLPMPVAEPQGLGLPVVGLPVKGGRALIIEADPSSRTRLTEQLEAAGWKAEFLDDLEQLVDDLREAASTGNPYQACIFSHYAVRPLHVDLACRLKADPRVAPVALVMITAVGSPGEGKRLWHAGFAGYLRKPVPADEITEMLQAIERVGPDGRGGSLITRHSLAEARNAQSFATDGIDAMLASLTAPAAASATTSLPAGLASESRNDEDEEPVEIADLVSEQAEESTAEVGPETALLSEPETVTEPEVVESNVAAPSARPETLDANVAPSLAEPDAVDSTVDAPSTEPEPSEASAVESPSAPEIIEAGAADSTSAPEIIEAGAADSTSAPETIEATAVSEDRDEPSSLASLSAAEAVESPVADDSLETATTDGATESQILASGQEPAAAPLEPTPAGTGAALVIATDDQDGDAGTGAAPVIATDDQDGDAGNEIEPLAGLTGNEWETSPAVSAVEGLLDHVGREVGSDAVIEAIEVSPAGADIGESSVEASVTAEALVAEPDAVTAEIIDTPSGDPVSLELWAPTEIETRSSVAEVPLAPAIDFTVVEPAPAITSSEQLAITLSAEEEMRDQVESAETTDRTAGEAAPEVATTSTAETTDLVSEEASAPAPEVIPATAADPAAEPVAQLASEPAPAVETPAEPVATAVAATELPADLATLDIAGASILDQLAHGAGFFTQHIVASFLRQAPARIAELATAGNRGDGSRLTAALDGLRRAAGPVGAARLIAIADRMEIEVQADRIDAATALLGAIEHGFLEIRQSLELASSTGLPTDQPPVSSAFLEQIGPDREGPARSLAHKLVETFGSEAPARIADIRTAVRTGDAESAQRLAQTLKGMCGLIGAETLAKLSALVEADARLKRVGQADRYLDHIELELDRVKVALG